MDNHIHVPFLDLVPHSKATHIAINNGSWFDRKTWKDGIIPNDDADVVIAKGVKVFYDQESNARIHTLRVDGNLQFSQKKDTRLIVDYIAISDTGNLEIGTETNPIQAQANIIFAPVDPNKPEIDKNWDPNQLSRGLVAGNGAKVSVFGKEKTSYVTLADDHLAGAKKLTFSEPVPQNWKVGDTIVLTGTSWNKKGSHKDNSITEDEVLTIASINGNSITFRHNDVNGNALRFDHKTPKGFDLDIYVANLTRNVTFESEGGNDVSPSQGGHTMFMGHDTKIYYAGFYGLGRTNKDLFINNPRFDGQGKLVPGTGTNRGGRYPIHFHEILEHHHSDMDMKMDMGTAEVYGSAIWGSPGWGVTVHSSRADITDNVSFDVVGAHFLTEDGDEQATFRNNIAIKASGAVTDPTADLLRGFRKTIGDDDLGESGIGFWIDTSYSVSAFENNIATGMADAGIIVYGQNDNDDGPLISVSDLPKDLQYIAGNRKEIHAFKVPLRNFTDNSVYNSEAGVELRGLTRDDTGLDNTTKVGHDVQNVLSNLNVWGVQQHGVQISYASYLRLKDSLIVGDPNSPILRGGPAISSPNGFGIYADKNARAITYDNLHIEGFEFGASIPQTSYQGYNTEVPFTSSQLIGGRFINNIYNLSPAPGRVDNPSISTSLSPGRDNLPITPYFAIQGNPIFDIPTKDQSPTAKFTSISKGGLAIEFDGSESFDPDYSLTWSDSTNHPYTAGDNTIASFAWDYESDGVIDDFGRYVTHVYENPGTYSVTLQVTDRQGNTSTISQNITVKNQPFPNIVDSGEFNSIDTTFGRNSGTTSWSNFSEDWMKPGGHKWNHDTVNGWVYADNQGSGALTKVIYNESVLKGSQTIGFDAKNIGSNNTLRLQVFGVNGRFSFSNWNTKSPETVNYTIPFESVTLLDTGNIANNNFDWSNFTWDNINFGQGYEFIAIRFMTKGVEGKEFQAIDNVFIGNESVSSGDENTAPLASDDKAQTNEEQSVIIDVLANDRDADDDFLFVSNLTQSRNGTVVDNGDGTLTYTPNTNFSGNDSFSYTVSDLQGGSDTARVNITINPIDDVPITTDDSGKTSSDRTTVINVLSGDNIIQDPAFRGINGDFTGNSGTTDSTDAGKGWIKPSGHRWSKDTVNEWAYAYDTGALGLTQVIANNKTTQGLQTISFDGINSGSNNTLRLQVYGIDGHFKMSNWDTKTPVAAGNKPIRVDTLLNTNNLANSEFDWKNFSWDDINFGQGYEYIALRFVTGGVSDSTTEFQAIDNVFIGNESTSIAPLSNDNLSFNDYSLLSYSDAQDVNAIAKIEDNGDSLRITGNGWKRIAMPYEVTADTVLEFDFFSSKQGEIHGIGFDKDNEISSDLTFQLYGTQNWGNQSFDNYQASAGEWKKYRVDVGEFYTGNMKYLTFTNDHDVSNPTAESIFSNVRVYEKDTPIITNNSLTAMNTISGTEANDIIEGTSEDDLIDARDGNDILTGGGGNDILQGGNGEDTLEGGIGNDILRGGIGNDIFNFSANEGRDRIEDFQSGDKIRLQRIDPQSLELVEQNGNTFLDLGNNQGIELVGILPDVLNMNILASVVELIL